MHDDPMRLQHEYEDRQHRFARSDIYSLFTPAKPLRFQQRQQAVPVILRRYGFYPSAGRRILKIACRGSRP